MTTLEGLSVLVTGGTGSFGRALIGCLLDSHNPSRVAVLSRDEMKQHEMRQQLGADSRMRYFIGDIRDAERLRRAFDGVDVVIHAAALKQVDTAEYNPFEYVKTNVLGSQNVIDAAIDCGVAKVLALSTDKASSPINLYGATKLTADKLFVAANNYGQRGGTAFSVVRYGNVMASRGSVIPFFQDLARGKKPIPITDERMTRFWITLDQAVEFVLESIHHMAGGELYVPRIPSMRLVDLVEAIAPGCETFHVGIRPGEKLHEEMISQEDSSRAYLVDESRYLVAPTIAQWGFHHGDAKPVELGFSYRSDTNDQWLSITDLRQMLAKA